MKNLKTLKKHLQDNLDPLPIFADLLDMQEKELLRQEEHSIYCPFHPDDKGTSKSFSFNVKTGKYVCHSGNCDARGSSIVNFHEHISGESFKNSMKTLYDKYIRPIVPSHIVKETHTNLMGTPMMLKYLTQKRMISDDIISARKLGYDGNSITIPIFNEFGFCVNIRRYNPSRDAKIISYRKGYGKIELFPKENLDGTNYIILCEGEFDVMLLESHGYEAVTATAGADSWHEDFNPYFDNKRVYICYDNDKAGEKGAENVGNMLKGFASEIRRIKIPIDKEGADVTDYFIAGHTKKEFDKLMRKSEVVKEASKIKKTQEKLQVSLFEASLAKYYYRDVSIKARVSGKEVLPYYIPKKVKITCTNFDKHNCFCDTGKTRVFGIDKWNKDLLKLINTTEGSRDLNLKVSLQVPNACAAKVEVLEQYNAEQLRLTPDVDFASTGQFVARRAFYLGHGIDSNKSYEFDTYSVPDPKTQQVVHIITGKKDTKDSLENFNLSHSLVDDIKNRFKPRKSLPEFIMDKFNETAQWQSEFVTRIKRRPDLHIMTDICYHSLSSFDFNGELVKKGMIELLVLGDSRCGKGAIIEGLANYYNLGRIASGENCTYAGLVGGVQTIGKTFMITWGLIPEQDRGLYIIDEVSSMAIEDIGRMSRIRSEGLAEITKIITEKTWARARGIWISNSRWGKDIQTYNNGVEAIPELIGNMEDVSRFDLAIIVSKNEVSDEEINSSFDLTLDGDLYSKEMFRNMILWAWSRDASQVRFTESATSLILKESIRLGRTYSSSIPLIQSENIRIKLAKIAASVAAKCFSTFNNNTGVMIKTGHVEVAIKLIEDTYSKHNFGYNVYSRNKYSQENLKDEKETKLVVRAVGENVWAFIEGMLGQKRLTITDLADFTGMDKFDSKELVGKLVRLRCLQKEHTYYVKKPAFIKFLREYRK